MHFFLLTASLLTSGGSAFAQAPADSPTPAPTDASAGPVPAGPATVTVPTTAPTAPAQADPAVAQTTYDNQKLQRKSLAEASDLYLPTWHAVPDKSFAPWGVVHGDGKQVTAREFASLTGDVELVTRMDKRQKTAKILRWSLTGAGGLVFLAMAVPLIGVEPVEVGDEPDHDAFMSAPGATEKGYADAVSAWRENREISHQNSNRVLTAVTLGGTGALTIAAAQFAPGGATAREQIIPAYYSLDEVDEGILKYNIGLKRQLGLTAPDPTEVIIRPPPPPPTDPDALPEDEGEEDDDLLPQGSGGGVPLRPDELPMFQLAPAIGIGFLGVQGTF